jgi:hypothetical protein
MQLAFEKLGDHLLRMSDGEVGERSQWVTKPIEWSRVNPDLELVTDGNYSGYQDGTKFGVKEGHTFDPANVTLGYETAFKENYPAFKFMRERYNKPEVSFQVGVPAPVDMAVDVFGFAEAQQDESLTETYRVATAREITNIQKAAGDDVIFQIETVVGLVAIAMSPDDKKAETAEKIATGFAALAEATPKGTRYGAHLCLGDFHHKALATMNDATPLVILANAVAKAWPKDRPLQYIHGPFAAADKPGSLDESWYTPLKALDIPEDIRFVAGFIHEDVALNDQKQILAWIDEFTGRQVDVAAACGLGRRDTPEEAFDAMEKSIALIEG